LGGGRWKKKEEGKKQELTYPKKQSWKTARARQKRGKKPAGGRKDKNWGGLPKEKKSEKKHYPSSFFSG